MTRLQERKKARLNKKNKSRKESQIKQTNKNVVCSACFHCSYYPLNKNNCVTVAPLGAECLSKCNFM